VPVFVVAAFIESFLTRYTLIGNGFRLLIIGSSAAFLVFYYILLPIKRHRDARPA
jgi:ATP/ADP translocase